MATLDAAKCSYSLASRRHRPYQARLRSTAHRLGSATKPRCSGARVTISSSTPHSRWSHSASPRYPWSAHSFRSRGHCGNSCVSSSHAPRCSDRSAPTTSTPSSRPPVSTTMNRLRPVSRFPPVEAPLAPGARRPPVLGGQGGVDPLPGAGPQPQVVVVAHNVPVRELVRQQAPLAAGPQQVQQRVHHFAQIQAAPPPSPRRAGEQRLDQCPLGVCQIRRVGATCARLCHRSCTSEWATTPGANSVPSCCSTRYYLSKRALIITCPGIFRLDQI